MVWPATGWPKGDVEGAADMLRPPRIVITDIDEDPELRKTKRKGEIKDWSALVVILATLWLSAITRTCLFPYGCLMALIPSTIAVAQFLIFIKTSYSARIGNSQWKPGPIHQPTVMERLREHFPCLQPKPVVKKVLVEDDPMNDRIPKIMNIH